MVNLLSFIPICSRNDNSIAQKSSLDSRLTEQILQLDEYKSCQTLFAFVSGEIECDTSAVIDDALKNGKRVAVPKCGEVSGEMDFYYINSRSDLSRGKFGILEPVSEKCERAEDYSSGLCLVPGLCFDYQGYRIGFGKGYYDRFLAQIPHAYKIGICFDFQKIKEEGLLPVTPTDICMDEII